MPFLPPEAHALNAAAIVHLGRRDASSAIAAALDASEAARRAGARAALGHARVSLGMSAQMLDGGAELAHRLVRGCIDEALAMGDAVLEVRARSALGIAAGDAGDFALAAAEFGRALLLSRVHASPTGPARILANIANLHRKIAVARFAAGDAQAARAECRAGIAVGLQACAEARGEGAQPVEGDALAIIGSLERLQGHVHSARQLLAQSAALGRPTRWGPALAWVLCERGVLEMEAGDLEAARRAYAEALEMAALLRPSCRIAAACQGLEETETRAGNLEAAGAWQARRAAEEADFDASRTRTRRTLAELALAA